MFLCHHISGYVGVKRDPQQMEDRLQACEVVELGVCCPVGNVVIIIMTIVNWNVLTGAE